MKKLNYLCYFIVFLIFVCGLVGIFYTTGGDRFTVENIYGESIELYGDGIYAYNSVFVVGVNKGTDYVMLIVAILFGIFTAIRSKSSKYKFVHVGLLTGILYYASCLVFGVTFNRLFLVYVLLFSASLFTYILLLCELIKEKNISEELNSKSLKGTALFMIVSGCSVLVWLPFIIPTITTGQPMSHIEIYTTEPTFVLDLGIILPIYLACGILVLKRKAIGYKLVPILLTFIITIGVIVIGQNIVQTSMGVDIPLESLIGLVFSFVVLGMIALILNIKFLKYIK
ncbi:hypothetical protein HYG86_05215 [Alkalicella caledoniensis]|uniref:Uncharacterized protein n=1 Tax=Alkalicella caledoniensis TaxID=2731377 RepID=A0A7G9W6A0_ALKCA|nr:hypothetical protein [Alkalicella caledoniensis]QNO14212.1 hypothetical protein HYG86_05215 [Alkalicella caledoniensis]